MIDDPKKHIEMPPLPPEEPTEQMATDEAAEVTEPVPTQTEVAEATPVYDQPTPQESWKAVREKTQRIERERDEALKRLQAYESAQQKQPQEETYGINLAADEIVEGKHLTEVQKELNAIKKELSSYKQQTTLSTAEQRLKSQFPDIDTVVNAENIQRLKEEHPEIAMSLNANSDFYSQAAAAYKVIKSLGIYQDPKLEVDRLQAQKNAAKPRPLTSVSPQQGDTPLSRANAFANGLTPELQAQLRKEMEDSRRGY
jgi:hypothetical protein